jgi:hypothetical protein
MVMQTLQIEIIRTVCPHTLSICYVHWESVKIPYAIDVVQTHLFILILLIEWMSRQLCDAVLYLQDRRWPVARWTQKGCYPSRSGGCFAAIQRWKFNVINGRRKRRKKVIRSSLISLRLGRLRASTSNAMSNSDGQNSH